MQLHGSGASTIVEFGPDGTEFDGPAQLALTFSSQDVELSTLGGYLVEEDGSYTEVGYSIKVNNKTITISINVSHFSEYTGDGGDA